MEQSTASHADVSHGQVVAASCVLAVWSVHVLGHAFPQRAWASLTPSSVRASGLSFEADAMPPLLPRLTAAGFLGRGSGRLRMALRGAEQV